MNKEGILEGLLFVTGSDGIKQQKLLEILDVNNEELNFLIKQLEEDYSKDNRGIKIKQYGNTYKLTTKEEHEKYYQALLADESSNDLSQAALECLAIIAYNFPVTIRQVEEIRGVGSREIVKKLEAKELIMACGKSEELGRAKLYKITDNFFDYFGITSIEELPKIDE